MHYGLTCVVKTEKASVASIERKNVSAWQLATLCSASALRYVNEFRSELYVGCGRGWAPPDRRMALAYYAASTWMCLTHLVSKPLTVSRLPGAAALRVVYSIRLRLIAHSVH